MGVGAVDRGPGARIALAAPRVGAVGPAVPRREEHVGARRDEGTGDLVERMVGARPPATGMRDPSIPVSTTATETPAPVSPARRRAGTPSRRATSRVAPIGAAPQ